MYWGQLYFTSTILSKGHKGANNFFKSAELEVSAVGRPGMGRRHHSNNEGF